MPGIPFKRPDEYSNVPIKSHADYSNELAARPMMAAATHHEPEKHPPHQPPHEPKRPEDDEPPPPKPQPEPHQPVETRAAISVAQLKDVLSVVINEARKPLIDERAVKARARMKEHNRQMNKDNLNMKIARFHSCNHMHMPGSVMTGCACIAWAIQSDQVKRGTCQHCGTNFSPNRGECISDEIWEAYKYLVRLPTHPAGNVNNIFMTA